MATSANIRLDLGSQTFIAGGHRKQLALGSQDMMVHVVTTVNSNLQKKHIPKKASSTLFWRPLIFGKDRQDVSFFCFFVDS